MIEDPHPDKGRALGRIEERTGRKIDKSGGHHSSLPSGEENVHTPEDEAQS